MAEERLPQAIILFGTEEPDPEGKLLSAGPLTAEFQNGQLRYIRLAGIEVLRAIAFIVRDESWGTYNPEIADLVIDEKPDAFRVTYNGRCAEGAVAYRASIEGSASGALVFSAQIRTTRVFRTNRTGFVILHPLAGCAGHPVEVEHVDGRRERASFPARVSPYQPFFSVRALTHEFAPGAVVTARLEGDTFEMEDHRNWTDASFKTYVRPIGLPWPYEIPAGAEIEQRVALSVVGKLPSSPRSAGSAEIAVTVGSGIGRMAQIGVELPAAEIAAARERLALLRKLGPNLIVGEVKRHLGHGREELAADREIAAACGARLTLEAALPRAGDPQAEAAALAEDCAAAGAAPDDVTIWAEADLKGVLPGSAWPVQPPLEAIRWAGMTAFPRARLGGGAYGFFTELNRRRPLAHFLDYISFTTTPIAHAADDRSVMETLEALPFVVESVKAIAQGKPWRVGPSGIGTRDNPYGAGPAANPDNRRVCMSEMDPRQRGLFAAAWTTGYLAAFARGGAEAVILGAGTGPRGCIHTRAAHPQPGFDAGEGRLVYPLFHVLRWAASGRGAELLDVESSAPKEVAALAWRKDGKTALIVANLTGGDRRIALSEAKRSALSMRLLDAAAFGEAARDPDWLDGKAAPLGGDHLLLPPYAVAFIAAGPA